MAVRLFKGSANKFAVKHWGAMRRREAIEAGAVPALCSVLGTGDDEPVSIEVLKALYTIIAPDGSGKLTQCLRSSTSQGSLHLFLYTYQLRMRARPFCTLCPE